MIESKLKPAEFCEENNILSLLWNVRIIIALEKLRQVIINGRQKKKKLVGKIIIKWNKRWTHKDKEEKDGKWVKETIKSRNKEGDSEDEGKKY